MPYRIDVDLTGSRGDAVDQLVDLGALDIEPVARGLAAIMPDDVDAGRVAAALGRANVRTRPASARDDGSVWVLGVRPIRAGRLHVVPAEWPGEKGALRIIDSPVFGSGLHVTTALCLEALDEELAAGTPAAVLDIGTGSGILALAALHAGVPRSVAVDVDGQATRMAARNAARNGLSARLLVVQGGPEVLSGTTWPLVMANIVAAPLMELAPMVTRLVGRGGRLVLSGIRTTLSAEVERTYRHLGMRRVRARDRDGWTTLTVHRSW